MMLSNFFFYTKCTAFLGGHFLGTRYSSWIGLLGGGACAIHRRSGLFTSSGLLFGDVILAGGGGCFFLLSLVLSIWPVTRGQQGYMVSVPSFSLTCWATISGWLFFFWEGSFERHRCLRLAARRPSRSETPTAAYRNGGYAADGQRPEGHRAEWVTHKPDPASFRSIFRPACDTGDWHPAKPADGS